MEVAGPLFDRSLALIVEKQVAQTARKRLEEHSYWDNTRRLTNLTNKHIAIPVTGQCGHALLSTEPEGNENISFLQSSDSDMNGDDWSKMGAHQSAGISEPTCLCKSSLSESGLTSIIETMTNPLHCCITPEKVQVTSPPIISSREKAQQTETDVRTKIRTLTDPQCCCDSPKKALPTSQNLSSREGAQQAENGSQPLLSTSHNVASQHLCPKCGHNQSTSSTHKDLQAIWCGEIFGLEAKLVRMDLPLSKKAQLTTPYDRLRAVIEGWVKEGKIQWKEELAKEIPKNWERHGDLILLPSSCFQDAAWSALPDLWSTVASTLNCTRIARRGRIRSDDFRSPRTEILLGTDPYVEHRDNGVNYTFDIQYSMFSSGNITEKLRIADLDCSEETVVDLYAGIGYFTLPYLVHAKAKLLYACEWNPHAVKALRKNLQLNNVNDRCVVLAGDNRKVCPKGVADRVNLGLIPSSEQGWPVACAALNPTTGGILHIHGNVASYPNKEWTGPTNTSCSKPEPSSNIHASECNNHDGRSSPTEQLTDPHGCECMTKSVDSRLDKRLSEASPCLISDSRHATAPINSEQNAVQAQLPPSYENHMSQSHCSFQALVDPEEIVPSTILPPNEATSNHQVTGGEDYPAGDSPSECSEGAATSARERTDHHRRQEPRNLQVLESKDSQPVDAEDNSQDKETVEHTRMGKTGSIPNGKPGDARGNSPSSSTNNLNVNGCQTEGESQLPNEGMYRVNLFNKNLSANCSEFKKKAWVDWGCHTVKRIKQLLGEQHGNRWSVEMVHIEHVKSYAPHIDHLVVDLKCRPIT